MRDSISLIANSGLQFYAFEAEIDPAEQKKNKFCFVEKFDSRRKKFWLEEVILLPGDDEYWARKSQLEMLGYLSKSGKLSNDIDLAKLELIDDTQFFEIGNISRALRYFEKKWIPLPYFKKNNISDDEFGPTDWVRVYFERVDEKVIKFVLLIDTSTTTDEKNSISPFLHENPNENVYCLPSNNNLLISYLDTLLNCQWVEDYISGVFYGNKFEPEKPFLKHVANYVFFTRLLRSVDKLPQITLLSDKTGFIDVNLVIDVGNSRTCALLFENPSSTFFNFNKVKKLEIQDLSDPLFNYNDSFSTRLVFKEPGFSAYYSELNQNHKFQWPSMVRIGNEAEKTINDANVELKLSRAVQTHNSSPKRYLWDRKPSETEWEFHLNDINIPPRRVYKKGISEQLNSDGTMCMDSVFGSKSMFSRKSLMTFVYLEIFTQALKQMNSIEFRSLHGSASYKRKLKRILISCPTAMIRQEQIALRECAQTAMAILNKYNGLTVDDQTDKDIYDYEVEIIPSIKDLSYNLENIEKKKDWIYDEATSAQLVYLYGMIQHKFGGKPELMFNLLGKQEQKANKNRSLVVGSLDIGGGTSDLMICRYDYTNKGITEITPDPLFWESINFAGDDLLKDLIQQIIIEGVVNKEGDRGCTGLIENTLREKGIGDVSGKLNGFFGKDSNNIGYKGKLMRTNFINQIAIPIIYRYMENANSGDEFELSYEELFPENKPNDALLNYFENHFEFRFEEIKWKVSAAKVNEIIDSVFSKLIKQIANIMHKFSCDVVVLAGRTCSFKALENLFYKYHSITPNRLINLNNYWIGRWYPFADNNGYVSDPKTIVTVGSLISLMGGSLFKLENFRINNVNLKNKLISTADYIGPIKNNRIKQVLLTPTKEEDEITIHSLPFLIGFKNINSEYYPARTIYSVKFSDERIQEVILRRGNVNEAALSDSIEDFKHKLRLRMPFTIRFSRDYTKDKEVISILEVMDAEQNDVSKSYFDMVVQTLLEEDGYWLDTGEFTLNTRN